MRKLSLLLAFTCSYMYGQDILETKIDSTYSNLPFFTVLEKIEQAHGFKFYYLNNWFAKVNPPSNVSKLTLREYIQQSIDPEISFVSMHGYAIYFFKDPKKSIEINNLIAKAQQEKKSVEEVVIGDKSSVKSQVTASGKVLNKKNGDPVVGATVQAKGQDIGTVTGAEGEFSISLPSGQSILEFSIVGFESRVINLFIYESGTLNLELDEQAKLLDEVVVSDQAINNPKSSNGLYKLTIADIKKMPSFMGEVDIVKQVQSLPGVTSVGEVSSGFNVRGGAADQNLILFDGLPIFNYSHVFGFFSAFNADAIKNASFYKGGIPAEFGGRVSSVLSIAGKDGDFKQWQGNAGIGLITSSLTVGGPIKKDQSSLIISVRSSYSDWMLKRFATRFKDIQNSSVSFYDITAKYTQKLGARDRLAISLYSSKDNFGLPNDTTFKWQNYLGSIRYDHIFSERLSFGIMAGTGQYGYTVTDTDPKTAYDLRYKITYPVLNFDMSLQLNRHKLLFGLNNTLYNLYPGQIKPTSAQSNIDKVNLDKNIGLESAVFINDGIEINDKLHLDVGLRLSTFSNFGPGKVFTYLKDSALRSDTRVDTVYYGKGKVSNRYFGLEPRISFRYSLGAHSSIKIGYNRVYQYIHLISNSVAVTPIDIWQISNQHIRPQIGQQGSLGYYQTVKEGLDLSVEGFYKSVENVLDFKDGADLVLNPAIETAVVRSLGKSYGVEFSLNKAKNAFVYSFNYTFARSLRRTNNKPAEETINKGEYFPSNYDQPHVVNLNWKYAPSRRFAITGNFTYHTGRATTVPVSYNIVDHVPIVNYTSRNGYRVPDYHRLDLAFVLEGNHRKGKLWQGTWTLSFYNVYARRNVYTVFYAPNAEGIQASYRMSIIGAVIPSLTYRIKF